MQTNIRTPCTVSHVHRFHAHKRARISHERLFFVCTQANPPPPPIDCDLIEFAERMQGVFFDARHGLASRTSVCVCVYAYLGTYSAMSYMYGAHADAQRACPSSPTPPRPPPLPTGTLGAIFDVCHLSIALKRTHLHSVYTVYTTYACTRRAHTVEQLILYRKIHW